MAAHAHTARPADAASEFDAVAARYDEELQVGLITTGESAEYYARKRIDRLSRRLTELRVTAESVLDFGCGTGSSVPHLLRLAGCRRVHGVDISEASLAVARKSYGAVNVTFGRPERLVPEHYDLAFCNGVFHHIAPAQRSEAAASVWRALRPGGLFALWENNPWNPGTRYVMSKVSFDRDAITLTPPETRWLLRSVGFEVARTDHLFFFPAALAFMRWLEPAILTLPLGGQYLVLGRKPASMRQLAASRAHSR
jgi:SAM-dependent methyltransferase